jgi:uncharacterized membrane protein
MSKFMNTHAFTLKKTASYYFTHITVAAAVAYAVTGDWLAALALSFLEPTVQAVVYFFHERIWARHEIKKGVAASPTHPIQVNAIV